MCFYFKKLHYYSPFAFFCNKKSDFGGKCSKDDECQEGLACDTIPTGQRTFTCSRIFSDKCSSSSDCVNNLICRKGECACEVI